MISDTVRSKNDNIIEVNKLKTYCSPKTIVKESFKGGKGFFSKEKITKGEIVAIKSGHIVDKQEAYRLDREIGDFSLQISDEFYLCPKTKEEIKDLVIFINHSCDPNIGMDGQVNYVAMRDIRAGEELCMDYAMAISGEYELECRCGSDKCRGIITGEDWKNEDLQKKYDKYFSWFLYKKIHYLE
jgi:SET domain-containing protein